MKWNLYSFSFRSSAPSPGECQPSGSTGLGAAKTTFGLGAAKSTFWIGLLLVGLVCGAMYFYRLGYWPWDVDELSSLEEMGLLDTEIRTTVYHPESIVVRLPRLVPVWYAVQKLLLRWLPVDEWGTRFLSAVCAVLAVMVLYGWGWRWRGPLFAAGLALLAGGSMLMVWLAQQNRFYTMAFFWLVLAEATIWTKSRHWGWLLGAAVLTLLAVFTHNVAIVLFGLQAAVVIVGWLLGGASGACTVRATLAGLLAAGVYLFHVRPIAGNWTGAGLTWAPPWASFTAHVGVPTVVLALLGSAVALTAAKQRRHMAVWAGMTVGVLVFVLLVSRLMPVWNPRYSLLWVLPLWVTGALAVETVATALCRWGDPLSGPPAGPTTNGALEKRNPLLSWLLLAGWYGCVGLLLAPKWASHWIDGTRHDYRQTAHLVVQCLQEKSFLSSLPGLPGQNDIPFGASAKDSVAPARSPPLGSEQRRSDIPGVTPKGSRSIPPIGPGGISWEASAIPTGAIPPVDPAAIPILTNMELQMLYYLPQPFRPHCRYWAPGMPLPPGECLVVLGGNGWEAPLALPGRTVQWIGLVGRRRFDELAHVVRIYWVAANKPPQQTR